MPQINPLLAFLPPPYGLQPAAGYPFSWSPTPFNSGLGIPSRPDVTSPPWQPGMPWHPDTGTMATQAPRPDFRPGPSLRYPERQIPGPPGIPPVAYAGNPVAPVDTVGDISNFDPFRLMGQAEPMGPELPVPGLTIPPYTGATPVGPQVDVTGQRDSDDFYKNLNYIKPDIQQQWPDYIPPDTGSRQQNAMAAGSPMWGLLAAGLGILANNTGHYGQAMPAIGKGGLIGLNVHLQEQERLRDEKFRRDALEQQTRYQDAQMTYLDAQARAATSKEARETVLRQQVDAIRKEMELTEDPTRYAMLQRNLANLVSPEEVFKADMAARSKDKDKLSSFQEQVNGLLQSGLSYEQAVGVATDRFQAVAEPFGGVRVVDRATGKQIGGTVQGTPQGKPPRTAVDPNLNVAGAAGVSGVLGNIANIMADLAEAELPYPDVNKSINALQNIKVQTKALLQAGIPGRPSVALMEQLETLTANPASLTQGKERVFDRLKQTRDMLRTEVERMERDILSGANPVKPDDLANTRMNHSQLTQLLREYDTILDNYRTQAKERKRKSVEQLLEEIEGGK